MNDSSSNMSGLLYNHWFWLKENTLIFSISEVGDIHHICVGTIGNNFKLM